MTANEFEARVARLEEHLVPLSAENHLRRAEEYLARGNRTFARHALQLAKSARRRREADNG